MDSRFPRDLLVLIVVIGLFGPGCGHRKRGSPTDGGVANGEYTNSFFGFALPVPNGWTVASQEALDAAAKGGKLAETADERLKASLKSTKKKMYTLVMFSEHPFGAAVPVNPSIVCAATTLNNLPAIRTGRDYLSTMREVVQRSNTGLQSRGLPQETQLGGCSFYRVQYGLGTPSGIMVEQAYYATVSSDRYALAFIVSGGSKDDLARVEAKLKNLRFQ